MKKSVCSKILSLALVAVMLMVIFPLSKETVAAIAAPEAGSIPIPDRATLAKIGTDASYPLNGKYHLTDNIDLSSAGWVPIGIGVTNQNVRNQNNRDTSKAFVGTFDGQGYTINGLHLLENSKRKYAGLFGLVSGFATIKNVGVNIHPNGVTARIARDDATQSYAYAGGLIGEVYAGTVKIENCYVKGGKIYAYASNLDIGAIVRSYAGGLIGNHDGGGTLEINNCYVVNNVQADANGPAGTGAPRAGDLIGYRNGSSILLGVYSPATQTVSVNKETGDINYSSTFRIPATQIGQKSSYGGFDFDRIWDIITSQNDGYPILRVESGNPSSEHTYSNWTTITFPTCTATGTEIRVCTDCGEMEIRTIAALGHTDANWYCGRCGVRLGVSPTTLSLYYKASARLTISATGTVTWTSSNPTVATVDQSGYVTAVGKSGAAIITAITLDGQSSTCLVNVSMNIFQWIVYYLFFGWLWGF